jgi:hypothetical protein
MVSTNVRLRSKSDSWATGGGYGYRIRVEYECEASQLGRSELSTIFNRGTDQTHPGAGGQAAKECPASGPALGLQPAVAPEPVATGASAAGVALRPRHSARACSASAAEGDTSSTFKGNHDSARDEQRLTRRVKRQNLKSGCATSAQTTVSWPLAPAREAACANRYPAAARPPRRGLAAHHRVPRSRCAARSAGAQSIVPCGPVRSVRR